MQRASGRRALAGLCFVVGVLSLSLSANAGGMKEGATATSCIPPVQEWLTQGGIDLASVD